MALITNAALNVRINAILTAWEVHQDEFQDWIGGVVDGGAGNDGKYPLTDRDETIRLTLSPAQLEDNVTGAVADAETAETNAAASATAAAASATTATTQASLAATARTDAQTAESGAQSADSSASTHATNAAADAALTAADVISTAADAVTTAADVVLTNADVVLTNADVVLTAADVVLTGLDVTYAAEWATAVEDLLISAAAGGDQATDYSALHWAAKAEATAQTIGTLDSLSDVVITAIASGELVKWDGSNFINQTLAEAGVSATGHTHATGDVTSGTFASARISQASVTQHEAAIDHDALTNFAANEHFTVASIDHDALTNFVAGEHLLVGAIDHDSLLNFVSGEHFLQSAISITESQISDLQAYLTSETSHADVLVDADIGGSVQAHDADTAKTDVNEVISAAWKFSSLVVDGATTAQLTLDAGTSTCDILYTSAGALKALVRYDNSIPSIVWQDRDPSAVTRMTLNLNSGALALTGALTTTSTVDGRDVASDGTKLDGIAASANNYSHPSHAGDDWSVDTGLLGTAAVISDIDCNLTTDAEGHVTDANFTIATRNLTAANIGAATSGHTHTISGVTDLDAEAASIENVSGNYGSIQVSGANGSSGTWHGFSIAGRLVLMDNAGSAALNRGGLFDDLNNRWIYQYNPLALDELSLYHSGTKVMYTTALGMLRVSQGAFVHHAATGNTSGKITVSTSSASGGANGDMWFKY